MASTSTPTSTSKAEVASASAARKAKLLHLVTVSDHIHAIASSAERLQAAYANFESYLDLGSIVLPPHYAPVLDEVAFQIRDLADSITKKCDASKPKIVDEMPPLETVGALAPDSNPPKLDTARAVSISMAPDAVVPVFDIPGEVIVDSAATRRLASATQPSATTVRSVSDVVAMIDDFFDASTIDSPQSVVIIGPAKSAKKAAIYDMVSESRDWFDLVTIMACGDIEAEHANLHADKYLDEDENVTLGRFSMTALSDLVVAQELQKRRFGKVAQTALVVHFEEGTSNYVLDAAGPLFERALLVGVTLFVTAPSIASLPHWRSPIKSVGLAFNADDSLKQAVCRHYFASRFAPSDFCMIYDRCVLRTKSCLFVCREGTESVKIKLFRVIGDTCRFDQPSPSTAPVASSSAPK